MMMDLLPCSKQHHFHSTTWCDHQKPCPFCTKFSDFHLLPNSQVIHCDNWHCHDHESFCTFQVHYSVTSSKQMAPLLYWFRFQQLTQLPNGEVLVGTIQTPCFFVCNELIVWCTQSLRSSFSERLSHCQVFHYVCVHCNGHDCLCTLQVHRSTKSRGRGC
jgi:hypothetical protein